MASAEARKAKSRLSASLDVVEASMEPLFSSQQSLPEILLGLEPLQQAKLQTALPYLVYDLIFIYLRTRGIDPKSHPVINELDRVRQYFDKIKDAENPSVRATQVDKAAANRFIKHAISQAQISPDLANSSRGEGTSTLVHVPAKVTSKMLEREEWQRRVEDAGSEEDDDELEGWEGVEDDASKGKEKAPEEKSGSKRRLPTMAPFGYADAPKKAGKKKAKRA
ncbi:hypothetical protein D9757_002295 [Collybiopsis confluens]|uniref:Exosome complex protein n=1 Tax=Collybiopsis confluens TaxID=2823264 RepID=A0A8H5HZW2_9AGAR|nr:hypothetical protein D9757_002295 [Collybiopsis confluens]